MASSIVRGRYLVAGVEGDDRPIVIDDGALYQEDGTIVAVGRFDELRARYRADETLGSSHHAVLPGLVNSHHHVGLTPLQLGSPDYPLEQWFASRMAARDVDPYLDALYGAFEMIESGVTTVQHLWGLRRGPIERWDGAIERTLQAYRDVGLRVSLSMSARDQNRLVYEPDEDFACRLPGELGQRFLDYLSGVRISGREHVQRFFVDLYERHGRNQDELVRFWIAPHNVYSCSDDTLMAAKERAVAYRAGIHIHCLETMYQRLYNERTHGVTPVRHLQNLGFLGPDVTLGHGVWLTEDDIDIIVETGTNICHNCSSNLRLQSGVAPLNRYAERGVRVAIGMDEAGLNDDRDMLQEMRLVLKLHRVPGIGARVPTCGQVLKMATENGAWTTPFQGRVGSIAPGMGADCSLVDLAHVLGPYLDPDTPIVDAIVQRARSRDVATVVIAGRVVLRDGVITGVDKAAALAELRASLGAPRTPDEVARRQLSRDLFPYVTRFYDDWNLTRDRPYYAPSQRG